MKAILILCLLTLLFASIMGSILSEERFEIGSDYLDILSVPTEFYGQTKTMHNFTLAEFNDRFFKEALEASIQKIDENAFEDESNNPPKNLLERTDDGLSRALNDRLPSGETQLFAVSLSFAESIRSIKKDRYVLQSRHIVHRDGRIYGADVILKTLHAPNQAVKIIGYKLNGFVFEDRIDGAKPSNLFESDAHAMYSIDPNFLKDKKYEKQTMCKYLNDLKKYRQITVEIPDECKQDLDLDAINFS